MVDFARALGTLPEFLQGEVAQHWQHFQAVAVRTGVPPPTDSATLKQLVRVWAGSEFVARTCSRDPHLLQQLLQSGLESPGSGYATRLAVELAGVEDEEQLGASLRRFRRREMVRIAWRDLAGLADLETIMAELSELADAVLEGALHTLYGWQCDRFGVPRDSAGEAQQLVVLGAGKLGGQELNFSSDIDLIFAFPHQGQTDGRRPTSNEEFFLRLGQRLIKALHEPTAEGFVFRVDMRLRPFGNAGPLAISFDAFEHYCQSHGREWERYALIKARACTGDQAAGEQLLACLHPFIYRRYLDYGAIESLRDMKALIAKEVERKGLRGNIKLGPGGIREIEFIGQVFQLIYGGREPALQERSILRVLDILATSGHLPAQDVVGLKQAYCFLRRVENHLQIWADQQTHTLPADPVAKQRLAWTMGYPDWDAFSEEYSQYTAMVSAQFEHLFASPQARANASAALDFAALWSGALGEESALRFLGEQGFDHPAVVWHNLQHLRQSFSYRTLSQRGRERMDKLIPLVLSVAVTADHPAITLERVIHLLETVARRSVYLALLIESPLALSHLVKLCAASVWISRHLARYPLLLDELLDPPTLYQPLDRSHLEAELTRQLAQAQADDTEQIMDALRHFKQTNVLRVAAADVSGIMPLMVVSDHLTEIAEVLLRRVLELAWVSLLPLYGEPCCALAGERRTAGFAVVAYGKLGGIELNYGSDLDLVFLHDSSGEYQQTNGPREIDNATFFTRLVQRIIHLLTTRTAAGQLYEVDTRLRPSGRSGLLVSSIDAFAEYQRNQAWTWEHQALVRARVVAGSPALAERFAALRRDVLVRERDPIGLRQAVRDMRERMKLELGLHQPGYFHLKQDPGGIADIEFMVQYAVLANAHRYPQLLTYTDNIRQLAGLEHFGVFSSQEIALLRDGYRALRRRIHGLTLQEQPTLIPETELQDYREGIVHLWQQVMESV